MPPLWLAYYASRTVPISRMLPLLNVVIRLNAMHTLTFVSSTFQHP